MVRHDRPLVDAQIKNLRKLVDVHLETRLGDSIDRPEDVQQAAEH